MEVRKALKIKHAWGDLWFPGYRKLTLEKSAMRFKNGEGCILMEKN